MKQRNRYIRNFFDTLSSLSIILKIYGMVFIVIILITVISLFVVRISITNTLTNELHDKAKSIASDVSARSVDLVITKNIYTLKKLVTDTVDHYPDLEYVFILDEQGDLLVHSVDSQTISNELIKANQLKKENNIFFQSLQSFESDSGTIIDVASPVMEDFGGTVRVGLRLDSLNDTLKRVTSQILITTIGVLVLAVLIVLTLTRTITYPITKLVELTSDVANGNLTKRIMVYPNDEIGKLTNSFNHMLDHLQQSENKREEFFNTIQNRNKELLLLNELSNSSVTSIEQVRTLLQEFVTHLVKELSLNSATIKVEILGEVETFHYTLLNCDHHCISEGNEEKSKCRCGQIDKAIFNTFPLAINNKKIGSIRICSQNNLNEYLVHIIQSITSQISMLLENVHLWHELKKKEEIRVRLLEKVISVQEDERKRIARELHDETSHSLSTILLGLKIIQESKTEHERLEQLGQLRNLTQQTMKEVHNLAWQLRPTILDKFGLTVALERYIEEFQGSNHIDVDLVIKGMGNERLKPEVETAIFRMIQEALTNIAKYAKATFVSIILIAKEQQISIVVEDDGIGFESEKVLSRTPSQHNLGLHGMMERIHLLGGSLDIESVLDEGTTIFAKIPMMNEKVGSA
ncbi:HAMP domain-containing sensor histidine kinase [Schinkia azotoformans]|uniref:HAMP domain-containing sensor histidine kinase n=1 Tax=Schinkia azotoformans TaxID=1454 RepID=UPI002DB65238|nr:ATP-binding protein [Schinkia azotoformans]MEC1718933.1 HAMP domain-containing protein [Schinkia azotoformans]MED4412855.1 HAMP domain-containing protein [Schinkia azotoformans]